MSQLQEEYKTRTLKPERVSEHTEQANFINEVDLRFHFRDDFIPLLLFAVPNGAWFGGKNPWAMFAKFKAEGFKKGVSDLLYLQPRGEYNRLAIEMKAQDRLNEKDGGVSPEQAAFLAAVNENGGTGEVCYSAEQAIQIFSWYMSLPVRGG